ncbi:MAG: MFS transporter [Gammaproteobacteria bacterium]
MAVLATSTALFILVESGFTVIGPLWATRDLGLDNAGWAFLRSASELGAFFSVLALGMVTERVGSRRMSALALASAGLALAGMTAGVPAIWLMPIFGAFLSITYVNFNTLTQRVSSQRRSLANAIYRAAGAGAAIAAPIAGTFAAHAFGAYTPVIAAAALVLGVAGLVILFYPEPGTSGAPKSMPQMLAAYRRCLTQRPLLVFIALSRGFGIAVAAVGAFAALRFTRELHLSEPAFGALCSAIAIGNLFVILASGWLVDRLRPPTVLGLAWLACSMAALAMGLSDSLTVAIVAYALFGPLFAMCSVPLSIWASRIADDAGPDGPGEAAVFTVLKVFQTGANMLVLALLGVLEPLVGMATLMWGGGLLGLPLALTAVRFGALTRFSARD